jgi:hypothetical protein
MVVQHSAEGEIACEMAEFTGANFHPIPIRQSDIADNFADAIWHRKLCASMVMGFRNTCSAELFEPGQRQHEQEGLLLR